MILFSAALRALKSLTESPAEPEPQAVDEHPIQYPTGATKTVIGDSTIISTHTGASGGGTGC